MNEDETKMIAEVSFALAGENRQRSSVADKEINLGDMAVYTSNFGISVVYQCVYSTALTVSSGAFDVQTVSAFGQNTGVGNLATGFSMNLSSPTGEKFIMGGQLEVGIEWSARFLDQFSFRIKDCSVQHGDTSVAVIKQGCYAGLLDAHPVKKSSDLIEAFMFNMFKGIDEETQTQVISCEVKVCKDYCATALGNADCPIDAVMKFSRA